MMSRSGRLSTGVMLDYVGNENSEMSMEVDRMLLLGISVALLNFNTDILY